MSKANKIYLDYASTTPVSKKAFDAMRPYFSSKFGNPSSIHILGQEALGVLDSARADVAEVLNCSWDEVVFTSSATLSINIALRGAVKAAVKKGIEKPHIITTNIEHSAVMNTCADLEAEGAEITYLPVNGEGFVSAEQVKEAIKENTVLVSIGYVNNEMGTIQPIAEISEVIKTYNLVFHTDAVQAANYLDLDVENLGVDLMTLSSHKIYGPKGAALLYKKNNVELEHILTGGPQERGLYPGTENIPAIVGFSAALKEAQAIKREEHKRLTELRDYFIDKITESSSDITLNGSREKRIPNNVNICFNNKPSETLIPALDAKGIYTSGGSACTARAIKPSHVIEAISRPACRPPAGTRAGDESGAGRPQCAKTSLRLTLGRHTTKKDIDKTIKALNAINKQ